MSNFKPQCDLLKSLEFQKHMAETRSEHYSPLKAHVLEKLFHILRVEIADSNKHYPTHNEIQVAALYMWRQYKDAATLTLYPEISIVESIMSAEEKRVTNATHQMLASELWEAALNETFKKFESMPAAELFALAREHSEKGERFLPSAFVKLESV